jgi:hypothetical protein
MLKQFRQAALWVCIICLPQIAAAQLVMPPPESAENPVTEPKRVLGKILSGKSNFPVTIPSPAVPAISRQQVV